MNILDQKENQVEITAKQFYLMKVNGAVDTNEFTLFNVDTFTDMFNVAVARWNNSTNCYLVHIKIKEE